VDSETDGQQHWLKTAGELGLQAARRHLLAGVLLWLFGVSIVLAYYYWQPARTVFDQISQLKMAWGVGFAILSTSLFGGLIPSLITACNNGLSAARNFYLIWTNVLLWGVKGLEIDLLYQAEARVFGADNQFSTIFTKTLFDQFIYVPIFGLPNVILFLLWRDLDFSGKRFKLAMGPHWYRERILPILISNWVLWIPAVALIYSLPTSLQLPIQNLVLVFWNLILVFFTNRKFSGRASDEARSPASGASG
jgi:hypothetical protein